MCLIIMLYRLFGVAEPSMLPHLIHSPSKARCIIHRILLTQFNSAFIMFIELVWFCIHHRIHSIEAGLYLFSLEALVFFQRGAFGYFNLIMSQTSSDIKVRLIINRLYAVIIAN